MQVGTNAAAGLVFNIQKYSIHDGPGIRTTVFLKGCPLRCKWCSNPESLNRYPEIMVRATRCNGCGKCVDACARRAVGLSEDKVISIDRSLCDLCLKCVDACFDEAIEVAGKYFSVGEVADECQKDEIFYRNSEGGVTLSGGEPLLQGEFTLNLLKECKGRSLHTALDTSGYADGSFCERVLQYTDLVLFDVKHLDPRKHHEATGVSNELILRNLRRIAASKSRLWVRIPVIPDFNDSEQHMEELATILKDVPAEKISLLGYHEWGRPKYGALGRDYPLDGSRQLSDARLESLSAAFDSRGLPVTLGY